VIVVIPTCRGVNLRSLAPLIDHGCRFIVIDDTAGSIRIDHRQFEVYDRSDRTRLLGRNEIAIPTGNGACRDLGFYIAWREGDADEIIVALDDDCIVESPEFISRVTSLFVSGGRAGISGSGRHFNIFDLYDDPTIRSQYPRGFPYSARVDYTPWRVDAGDHGPVRMNLGLWTGFLDINAVDRISGGADDYQDATLRVENVAVPKGTMISVCSGNMQFSRSLIPAIYQLPMNVEIMPGWRINRYGDIWGGFILKTLMDRRGDRMSVGQPLVRHTRIGPAATNVREEHLAHLVNEQFLDLLDRACEEVEPQDYLDMMDCLREQFARFSGGTTPVLKSYLGALDRSLGAWISALRSRPQ